MERKTANQQSGFGIAGMVIGIISMLLSCFMIGGVIGIIGIILSIIGATQKGKKTGMAIAGIVLNTIAIVITIVVIMIIAVISNTDTSGSDNTQIDSKTESVADINISEEINEQAQEENTEPESNSTLESGSEEENQTVDLYVEQKEIYNENNVVIRVQNCDIEKKYVILQFLIENNSALNLGFNARAYSVNGVMSGNNIYDMDCDVAAGKKANAELKIKKSFLDQYNIDIIESVDILFWAYDNDKSFKEFDTGQITIYTNYYDKDIKIISGKSIYENNGIKIEYLSKNNNEYTYCITNNTGEYFDFDVENLTINDYTSSDWDFDLINVIVLDSCQSIFTIKVKDDFTKLNSIENVEKIEFTLDVRPLEDYHLKWSTEMILSEGF